VSLDPKICSRMAWKEWPGSESMKRASSETGTVGEEREETERGLDSVPVRPSMSGREDLSQPRTWSKERFSITITTMVLIGPGILCFLRKATAEVAAGERRRRRRSRGRGTRRRRGISSSAGNWKNEIGKRRSKEFVFLTGEVMVVS